MSNSKKENANKSNAKEGGEVVRKSIKNDRPNFLPPETPGEEITPQSNADKPTNKPFAKMTIKEIKALPEEERAKIFKRPEVRQAWKQFSETILKAMFDENIELEIDDEELKKYIEQEYKKAQKDPAFRNITIDDIFAAQQADADPKSRAAIILERAKAKQQFETKHPLQPQYGGKNGVKKIPKNNSALINAMQYNEQIGAGAFDLPVIPKKEITNYVEMSFKNDEKGVYSMISNITSYERMILDRIAAMFRYANEHDFPCVIDGDIIGKLMPGNHDKVKDKEADEINAAIEKLRHLFIYIDATDEMRQRGHYVPNGDAFTIDGYCLNLIGIRYRTRTGQLKAGYIVVNDPLPQYYAELTGQLTAVNVDLLDIKQTAFNNGKFLIMENSPVVMSKDRQIITDYMHRRVMVMKNQLDKAKDAYRKNEAKRSKQKKEDKPQDNYKPLEFYERSQGLTPVIRFDAILNELKIEYSGDKKSRDKLMDIKAFCKQALDYWQARGFISGYEFEGRGSNAKIRIDL